MKLSANIAQLQPSATIALASRCRELQAAGRDVLNLSVGEPDFPTPGFIVEAAVRAVREGQTRYTASPGIPALREAIAADLERLSPGFGRVDPGAIVVSSGAKQALFNACFALFGPGDRVLIPTPYWTTYPALVELARAEPVFVAGDPARGHKVTPDDLERAAGAAGAAGLLLNSPSNPTGAVYSRDELEAIARWAHERGVWLVSDEIYRQIYAPGRCAPGLLDLDADLLERAVVIDGASKAFAMTGWRIGFSWSDARLAARFSALQSQTVSQAATPSQHAALAAYTADAAGRAEIEAMGAAFARRRARVVELFRERLPGVGFVEPEGAFYLFFETAGLARDGEGSTALCERLLEQAGVALVPGDAFGDDRYVRLSYACSEAELEEGVARIARARG